MDLGLKGKVAFVAASSRGLGAAIGEGLAAEGVHIACCARSAEIHDKAASLAARFGVEAIGIEADVSQPADVTRAVDAAMARFGRVDILVTNAGGPPPGRFETHAPEAWDKAIALNLGSVVNLVRAVLPGMKARRWGRILNVTSIAVKQPVDNLILSNSVRAAVTGFARTLANEVAPHNITVNNLMPGYTRTERLDQLAAANAAAKGGGTASEFAAWERQIPMGRVGEPQEFAALATFLASERASYITAQSIAVDGGWIRSLL
ncbi:MAG TPA: SDR family oxidoreductase [Gemmatimonadaceae bacterium]|nr:SDR family oxidoreductase [Gemmatimonadaceae bacterium]HRQ77273.1 SDR family oxidoreductase [Gemmatimonadaceae bacterium]